MSTSMNATRARLAVLAVLAWVSTCAAAERPIRLDAQGSPIPDTATSFDCAKAQGFAETLICSDLGLAFNDREIDETYQRLLRHRGPGAREALRQGQREWLHRRNTCAQRKCLEAALEGRDQALRSELDGLDRALRAKVRQVGQCEETRIDFIGARLTQAEGEPPDGMSVGYADGVWQVSYDRVPEVLKSRVGDLVRICLVSKPRNCPLGDDRGRVYSVQNLQTHMRWKLPDASHVCGGA